MVTAEPQRILEWRPESQEAFNYFHSIDWCRELLQFIPGLRHFRVDYENRKARGWDPVVSGILAHPYAAGVRHFLSTLADAKTFARLDSPQNANRVYGTHQEPRPITDDFLNHVHLVPAFVPIPEEINPFPQHINFYTLGADLAGAPDLAHGGVIGLLIDSIFTQIGFVHADPHAQFYIDSIFVRFLRPLIIPPAPQNTTSPQQDHMQQDSMQQDHMQQDHDDGQYSSPLSSAAVTVVGDSLSVKGVEHRNGAAAGSIGGGGVVNVIVRAQIDGFATKEGEAKMCVLAQVETEGGVVCAIGEGVLMERWRSPL
ncbi:hypothetical protein PG997_014358 [Apiospora hydei]|uniref:Thioesterase domain-containing protein n=1 Tax=Apiospora hydei TaxID=1337664 RepID=A0ABR1UTK1_9PEZI